MPIQHFPYRETGYFSKLMCDYLDHVEATKPFYHRFPKLSEFKLQLKEKQESFPESLRSTLVRQLEKQYENYSISEATKENITSLSSPQTFTVTTGHQLNLFTGPLYFLYKIFSVINLAEQLKANNPEYHFVPVYWMATEDHDFQEINYFNAFNKKVVWDKTSSGAVGELSMEGLEEVLKVFEKELGESRNAKQLALLFSEAYLHHKSLADATRYLGNALFKDYGLVIVDGNDTELKKAFIPYAEKELTENLSFHKVIHTTSKLIEVGYGEQVHPREINLFYLDKGLRERIIEQEGTFFINNTDLSFSKEEILAEVRNRPEKFSPNALLRPLYQEAILPNLCYAGGGGELAYWFQLKHYFESVKIPFPILLLRNSALLVPSRYSEKLKKLNVGIEQLFQKQEILKTQFTHQLSDIKIDFSQQREHLQKQFRDLYEIARQTDGSFQGAVGAQEKKQLNGLDHLEKRLLKAQKRRLADQIERLTAIQDALYPHKGLQERTVNFSEFYMEFGDRLLSELKENLDPLAHEFTILTLKS
ncbi:MAG: bacillithiol biosynthesis cysteine-adding enzyme BshC [Bacteroidota bacterium]